MSPTGGPDAGPRPSAAVVRTGRRHLPRWLQAGVLVAVIGLAATGLLVWLTGIVNTHTDQHLLALQTKEASDILGEIVPTIRTPLVTAAAIADVTGGDLTRVGNYVAHDVGTTPGRLFRSLEIWRVGTGGPRLLFSLGRAPTLSRAALLDLVTHVDGDGVLDVHGQLAGPHPTLSYAVASLSSSQRYVVYAESPIPPSRRSPAPKTSAFSDINFALYLGRSATPSHLIESTAPLPLASPTAGAVIAFGSSDLYFIASPTRPLQGGLLSALPWVVGVVGVVLTAAGVAMAEWLVRRRRLAERLARENHRLYAEQRSIAQALQTALLPSDLPRFEGVNLEVRYLPGDPAADIGGDWYDVIRCDDSHFLFVVGDVSGRGVVAARSMASLHFSIRAYAAQGDSPGTILSKLCTLLDVRRDGHFATVLLGHVDIARRRLTLVNAGHPPPLVVSADGVEFASVVPGTPIGVDPWARYDAVTLDVAPGAVVLAYTDGLIERRGEILDVGLDRLRLAASAGGRSTTLVDLVVSELVPGQERDDIALLELRWTS